MSVQGIMAELLIKDPYYGYLASKLRCSKNDRVKGVKIIWEDSPVFIYNAEWFDGMTKDNQKGILVHELLHIALLHFHRRDGRDRMLWNVACDVAVSELMDAYTLPRDVVTRQVVSSELGMKLEPKQTADYYYRSLSETEAVLNFTSKDGEAKIIFEGGESYAFDLLEEMVSEDLESQAIMDELTMVSMSASGEQSMTTEMLDQIEEVYRDYKIQWRSVLRRFLEGHGKIRTRKSYKRQSRRFDDLPGTKRAVGLQALLAIDESASISDKQIQVFHRELVRINKITGDDIQVVRFDTACSEPVSLQAFVKGDKRAMGGGTDFRPVFEMADKLRIKNVILFTDGDGKAPESVPQRVLWVLSNNGKAPVAYGTRVKFQESLNGL